MFLNCIVGQMDEPVYVSERVLRRRSSNVAFSKVVTLKFLRDQNPQPNVKFALANQQRPLDVLLNHKYICLDMSIWRLLCLILAINLTL